MAARDRFGPTHHGRLLRFDENGNLDSTLTNQFEIDGFSEISLKLQKDGKILLTGLSGSIDGEKCNGVIRLHPDGTIDRSFRCDTADGIEGKVLDCAIQEDGRIVICGFFSTVNEVSAPHIARINPDGSVDRSFKVPFLTFEEISWRKKVRIARLSKKRSPEGVETLHPSAIHTTEQPSSATAEIIFIRGITTAGDATVIKFTGIPGQAYVLQARDTLSSDDWI